MADNIVKLFGSTVEFETFGKNALAYVRRVESADINKRFPLDQDLPEGLDLWGLFGADGLPIALSDEKEILIENASELDLVTVAVQ